MTNSQMDRIEWKLDQILWALAQNGGYRGGDGPNNLPPHNLPPHNLSGGGAAPKIPSDPSQDEYLPPLTIKQHAVLQMLLNAKTNQQIAERFGVTDNTAKVYVRTIAGKLGVNRREQIVVRTLNAFNAIDGNSYRMISGGLPKDWDENFNEPDPFADLYARKYDGS